MTHQLKVPTLLLAILLLVLPMFSFSLKTADALSGSDFNASRIIDDHIFFDGNTMSTNDIQNFLNSKVPVCDTNGTQPYAGTTRAAYSASRGVSTPFICLKSYSQDVPARAPDAYCRGALSAGIKSAAQIIKDVSVACSVSPKVLIVLLQKEQSLITDDWPWPIQYRSATGYGCPDTAACDTEYYGFFNQVYYGARQFQRYAVQAHLFSYRHNRSNYIQYNPNAGCGGSNVFIQNQATAGLYNYTPYQPNAPALANLYGTGDGCSAYGNRNFWRMYSDWFGSTVSGICYNGVTGVKTDVQFHKYDSNADSADFIIYSGAGSGCVESHVWNSDFVSWKTHIASSQPGVSYPNTQLLFGDLDGTKREFPVFFGVAGTGSGMIEAHVLNKNWRNYQVHAISNRAVLPMADNEVAFGDLTGDGKDEPILIAYRNTSTGFTELHGWGGGLLSWVYHNPTNMPGMDPANNRVLFGDLNGDGQDEAVVVAFANTGSGKVEFHIWNAGQSTWQSHISSNLPAINPANGKVVLADLDGNGVDEGVFVSLKSTGSGRIEFHTWNPGFTSWKSNIASNQPMQP